MRVVIVGGTGFVGKSFADWVSRGSEVESVVLASRDPIKTAGAAFLNTVGQSHKVRLTKTGTLKFWRYVQSADAVIYAASSSNARDYSSGNQIMPADLSSINLYLSKHPPTIPIIYLSSGAVYGKQPFSVPRVAEDQIPWPHEAGKALYASIKTKAENDFLTFGNLKDCRVVIARLFAFCGAWLPIDQHFLIGNLLGAIERRSIFRFRAKHLVVRSYLGADELSKALYVLMQSGTRNEAYNVGCDIELFMQPTLHDICQRYGIPFEIPQFESSLLEDVDRYVPSTNKFYECCKIQKLNTPLIDIIEGSLLRRAELGLSQC